MQNTSKPNNGQQPVQGPPSLPQLKLSTVVVGCATRMDFFSPNGSWLVRHRSGQIIALVSEVILLCIRRAKQSRSKQVAYMAKLTHDNRLG